MLKPRSTNGHNSRESYLRAATNELRPYFAKLGLTLPDKIRYAVAFTSHGKKGKVAGECWQAGASDDCHHEIIIRADFADPAEVLGILVHELVHAALPPDVKHGKEFRAAWPFEVALDQSEKWVAFGTEWRAQRKIWRAEFRKVMPWDEFRRQVTGQTKPKRDDYTDALSLFGLVEPFTRPDMDARVKRIMQGVHPDTGGCDYLAQQVTAARTLILKRKGWKNEPQI